MAVRKLYVVPVTISEARNVEVLAHDEGEARKRIDNGQYERLGPKGERGFLLIGRPREVREEAKP